MLGVLGTIKLLPHKATVAEPLHRLLDKKAPWSWGPKHKAKVFQAAKDLLVSNLILAHFDEKRLVVLACNTSHYGVDTVLSHQLPKGKEVPIAYFSKTFILTECNYAQINKKGLAIVKGVKKFYNFLYGQPFTTVTNCKPLLGFLAPDQQTPPPPDAVTTGFVLVHLLFRLPVLPAAQTSKSHGAC